jgi:hypothetical protein
MQSSLAPFLASEFSQDHKITFNTLKNSFPVASHFILSDSEGDTNLKLYLRDHPEDNISIQATDVSSNG